MTCAVCGGEIRWDTEHYDRPRWVHVHIADTVTCLEPGNIRPAQAETEIQPLHQWRPVPSGTGWPVM